DDALRSSFHSALCLFLALVVVVVELIEQAAAVRLERPVVDARRPAGIGRGVECFAALSLRVVADDEVARDQIDLLPLVVRERRGGVDAGVEAQQPGAAAHLAALVEVARENFLLDPRGVAGRRGPAGVHVHAGKFKMRLVYRHGSTPATVASSSCAAMGGKRAAQDQEENARHTTGPTFGFRHWDRASTRESQPRMKRLSQV